MFMLPLVEPTHPLSVYFGILRTIMDGTYSAFIVPISIAFEVNLSTWSWVTICDMVAGGIEPEAACLGPGRAA